MCFQQNRPQKPFEFLWGEFYSPTQTSMAPQPVHDMGKKHIGRRMKQQLIIVSISNPSGYFIQQLTNLVHAVDLAIL